MGLTQTVLRSQAVAALTSPHGVDRYLEQVNPMWAAHEVRARIVDVHREVDVDPPVATLTLQPTSTWRGHRAGQHVQLGIEIEGARRTTRVFSVSSPTRAPATGSPSPCGPTRTVSSLAISWSERRPARWSTCRRPRVTLCFPTGCPTRSS